MTGTEDTATSQSLRSATAVTLIVALPLASILHFFGFKPFATLALITLIFQNLWSGRDGIMTPGEWIPNALKNGEATVKCHTCETVAEFDRETRVYECECDFGATVAALALGLPGYEWTNDE